MSKISTKQLAVLGAACGTSAAVAAIIYYFYEQSKNRDSQGLPNELPKVEISAEQSLSVKTRTKTLLQTFRESHQVLLINDLQTLNNILPGFIKDLANLKVIGLDTEWITQGSRNPISMLQLSTFNYTLLFRLHLLDVSQLPQPLLDVLQDRSIAKVGVSVLDDSGKLLSDYDIRLRGCVDLRFLAIRYRKTLAGYGLKRLAAEIADIDLDKSHALRRGDWESPQLSQDMIDYAAADSQAGLTIFIHLVMLKLEYDYVKAGLADVITYTDTDLLERIVGRCASLFHGILDVPYKANPDKIKGGDVSKAPTKKANGSNKDISSYALRSRPMYSNCEMLAPDGQLLCVCDVKKAQWYIEKGLAVKVSPDDAPEWKIRLKFEPRGRPSGERDYYRSLKDEICVVCGAKKKFVRKNIVPREYRKYFPEVLKSHSSHDVVLLCALCHKQSSLHDAEFKNHFADLCNAPYKAGGIRVDEDIKRLKSAARALNGYADRLPDAKRTEYTQIVRDHYGSEEVTQEMLDEACNKDDNGVSDVEHGKTVVEYYVTNSSIQEFQKLWRQRFVDLMEPQHLGEYWQVDYDHRDYLWIKNTEANSAAFIPDRRPDS